MDITANFLAALALTVSIMSLIISFRSERERGQSALVEKKTSAIVAMHAAIDTLEQAEQRLVRAVGKASPEQKEPMLKLLSRVRTAVVQAEKNIARLKEVEIDRDIGREMRSLLNGLSGDTICALAQVKNLATAAQIFCDEIELSRSP